MVAVSLLAALALVAVVAVATAHEDQPDRRDRAVGLYRGVSAQTWAMRYRVRTRQLQNARRVLFSRPTVIEALNLSCAVYGQCQTLWRRASCESGLEPTADNGSARGLFQFLDSTWASTPFGRFSVFSPYANALAAGWMHAQGRGSEWACR